MAYITSSRPEPLREDEYTTGPSWFHWCPNTHLHPLTRMLTVRKRLTDSWGKKYTIHGSWICPTCNIREYIAWSD